jgi:hypothetical protein
MPCLEAKDLSQLAEQHITSQKATITNLRSRKIELEAEEKRLSTQPDADTNPKLKQVREAVNHLRLELDGEVESPAGSRNFVKDPVKKTAEERVEVMAALYRERTQFEFHDTTKVEGKERKASVFGLPTVEEMQRLQHKDVADAMMVRATSLLLQRQDGRNPVDFLDTTGLDVKVPLANVVEHHHIYNNVHLDKDGRVEFKSFKIRQDRNTGELKMDIVPTYWNSEQHGRNTQFIGLLDGMHSGQDPVTHMHYYRFTDDEAKPIKEKIRSDIKGITDEAKTRQQRLERELSTLKERAADPEGYSRKLLSQKDSISALIEQKQSQVEHLIGKRKITPDEKAQREAFYKEKKDLLKSSEDLTSELEKHQSLISIKGDIEAGNSRISDLSAKASAIKLTDYPKGPERDAKRLEREAIIDQISTLKNENRDRKKLLEEKGDIEGQIKDAERKVGEAKAIASLSEKDALDMFDHSNGFLSFDKGAAEKKDHEQYRPLMNQELTRHYVRETLKYMEREYGDNALEALQNTARRQYQQNILERLGALQDKVKM